MFLIFAQPSESSVEVNVQELISQQLDGSNVLTEKNNTVTTCHDQQKKNSMSCFQVWLWSSFWPRSESKIVCAFQKEHRNED